MENTRLIKRLKGYVGFERTKLEQQYGVDNIEGKCIEASERLIAAFSKMSLDVEMVDGFCLYEDWDGLTDAPYTNHSMVKMYVPSIKEHVFIDITADQFKDRVNEDNGGVVFKVGKPPAWFRMEEPLEELNEFLDEY